MPDQAFQWAADAEACVLARARSLAPVHGWTSRLVAAAGDEAGLAPGEVDLLLPEGPRDLAALHARDCDRAALAALAGTDPAGLKMRDRIRAAAAARCEAAMRDEGAERACLGFLALPPNLALAARLAWGSADALWRWAGDTATDENHYSKRALLAAILASTVAVRLTSDAETAARHLDRRIEAVMRFEKLKARLRPPALASRAAEALGRLRYRRA
ncbi:MAG: COQ9 family protein [Caulobacteraceae bacterium]|nr:COQ9 family protein [Caulobacteraceae bacterium]